MKIKLNRFLKLSVFLITAFSFQTNYCFDSTYARILQQRIEYYKSAYSLVGISAAVDVPGQGQWLGTAGISHINNDMTPGMVFDVGSVTKNFVSALILQLAEANSLKLSDSIGTWLPQYPNVNNKVTVKQLLNHTSGLYNFTDNALWANAVNSDPNRFWTLEEVVSGYILAPYFAPGAGWHYSNTNYTLLTMIIRQITGSDLPALFRSRFYTPLNMNESFVELTDTITAPFAHNWILSGSQLIDIYGYPRTAFTSSAYGPGGVISRPENMLHWLKGLYNGQVISNAMLDSMLSFVNASISGANGYGLGTMRYNVGGRTCWGHAGNSFGHSSIAMYYPGQNVAISVMINKDINTGTIAVDFMNTVLNNNPIGIQPVNSEVPDKFSLEQNYPNPFNPETNISFSLKEKAFVKLEVFDSKGMLVETLLNEDMIAGNYKVKWSALSYSSGVYFCRLSAGKFIATRKMIVIK